MVPLNLEQTQTEFLEELIRPLLELYGFKKIDKITMKTLSAVRITDLEHSDGTSSPRRVRIDSRFFWGTPSTATIGLVLHEIAHQRRLGKVDSITANAFSYYFDGLDRLWEHSSALMHLTDISKEPELMKEVEEALQRKNYLQTLNKIRTNYPHLSRKKFWRVIEHEGSEIHKPYANNGMLLAHLALVTEVQKKKPGIGLFLIRDVSTGKKIAESIAKIARGDYERARKRLLQRYPYLQRGIMQTAYYQKNLHLGVRRRAAHLRKFHPEEVRQRARFRPLKGK
jgi:hypothetical protein